MLRISLPSLLVSVAMLSACGGGESDGDAIVVGAGSSSGYFAERFSGQQQGGLMLVRLTGERLNEMAASSGAALEAGNQRAVMVVECLFFALDDPRSALEEVARFPDQAREHFHSMLAKKEGGSPPIKRFVCP